MSIPAKLVRLTAAQATIRYLAAQHVVDSAGETLPYFAGCWAIFGHGNATGLGEALQGAQASLPTWRAHSEQGMAHAAIAFAKQSRRRRAMICTSSIGPGATNMVTAAALAHVNRLPVLFIPGDIFAGRAPDPVLQQIESFGDATISANDCFRPVSRLFDRIMRPEQLLDALPRAMATLSDPVSCGPVTLAFPQDVQTEAFDWPAGFFAPTVRRIRAPRPDAVELEDLVRALHAATAPVIVAGGGVLYAQAEAALAHFADRHGIPVGETQAGKGALAWDHPCNIGAIGVTGSPEANRIVAGADLVIGIGTRLSDFTTGSRALLRGGRQRLAQINVAPFDAAKHDALAVVGDAGEVLALLDAALADRKGGASRSPSMPGPEVSPQLPVEGLPDDRAVVDAVCRAVSPDAIVVGAAGGLPGVLHRRWRVRVPGSYHVEYGYSCMGYEIAGGLGAALAEPGRDVVVMIGDGSYLMLNSELATAVSLGIGLTVVLLDNRGHGCIDRLQRGSGGASFGTMLGETDSLIDFVAHARSLGAQAHAVSGVAELEHAVTQARGATTPTVIVLATRSGGDTDGAWWDVAIPEVSDRDASRSARRGYEQRLRARIEGAAS